MEYKEKMEVFSNLVKLEKLFPVEDKIIPGSLVFESLNPFPGYYNDTPDSSPPLYLYLALDKYYRLEEVLRAIQQVKTEFKQPFDAVKGILTIGYEEIMAIRLRHFGDYDVVVPLQEAFRDQGLPWLKRTKKPGEYTASVRIVKFMELKQIDQYLYKELKEDFHGYMEIPRHLGWNQFVTVTERVINNWLGSKFDAASGSFYYGEKLHEFVRIYSKRQDIEYLRQIRTLYLEKMRHF